MRRLAVITDKEISGGAGMSHAKPRRCVRAVLEDEGGNIALLHVEKVGCYTLPGGGIDEGESILEALKREVREEAGCACDVTRELGLVEMDSARLGNVEHSYCFAARVAGEKGAPSMTDEEINEGTRLGWYAPQAALALLRGYNDDMYELKFLKARDIAALRACYERGGGFAAACAPI